VPVAQQTVQSANNANLTELESALGNYASHLNGYLVGQFGYEVDIRFPAHESPEPTARIEMLNKEMLTAFLALFLLHGSMDTGTRNVTSEHMAFFRSVLQHKANYIADTLCKRGRAGTGLVPTLIDLNFPTRPGFRYPTVRFTGIKERDIGQFVMNLRHLVEGRVITPDDSLELYARKEMALPESSGKSRDIEDEPVV